MRGPATFTFARTNSSLTPQRGPRWVESRRRPSHCESEDTGESVCSAFSHFLLNRLHQIRKENRESDFRPCFSIHRDCWELNPIERRNLLMNLATQPREPTSIVNGCTVQLFCSQSVDDLEVSFGLPICASSTFSSSGTVRQ